MFLYCGLSQFSLNPSISIWVNKTIIISKALNGSELWSSMTPADLTKLEHSHRFCLKHMQDLPRRTPTNLTLSAVNAVTMETVINHKKLNFLGQLGNLRCSYTCIWLSVSSTSGSHISNTWTTRALVSSLILTEYWPSMLYTMYLIGFYQMECFPLSVHENKSYMNRLSNEVTLNFFMKVSRTIPLALHWYCVLRVWAVYGPWPDISRNCRLFAEGQWW